ncbi:MAG: hypothetical protein AAGJ81_10625 [Verrucomicrobiota bacterium]
MENQTRFAEPELTQRMEAALLGWVGHSCTFVREGKKRRGKLVGGEYLGMKRGKSQFRVLVEGKSGQQAWVDFRRDEVKVF